MAKRKSAKRSKKNTYVPTQRIMNLSMVPNQSIPLIRVDKHLSEANRRMYRQSYVYECKIDMDITFAPNTSIEVYALRSNWVAMNAYQLAYDAFRRNSREEDDIKSRWYDFRVEAGFGDLDSHSLLVGHDGTGSLSTIAEGEYGYTQVRDEAGSLRRMSWSETSADTFNIIGQYDLQQNLDSDPSSSTGIAPYQSLNDDTQQAMVLHLQQTGDQPPYERTTFSDEIWVKIATLSLPAAGLQKLSTGFFDAPCGMIVLKKTDSNFGSDGSLGKVTLSVKKGDYKGVSAHGMLDHKPLKE